MKNFRTFDSEELTKYEMNSINGGGPLTAAVAISAVGVGLTAAGMIILAFRAGFNAGQNSSY